MWNSGLDFGILDTNHVFDAGAVVGLGAFVPYVAELTPVLALKLNGVHELRGLEACSTD